MQTKKPPIVLVIEVNRRWVEIFIIIVYNRKHEKDKPEYAKVIFP